MGFIEKEAGENIDNNSTSSDAVSRKSNNSEERLNRFRKNVEYKLKGENEKNESGYVTHNKPHYRIVSSELLGLVAASKEESQKIESGDINMNSDDLLKMYLEKIEEDRRLLRDEFKEREIRIQHQIESSESRLNEKYEKFENLILNQGRELNGLIVNQNNRIDTLKDEVREQIESDKKYRHSNNIAIIIGTVTTVLTILGIVLAAQANITDIISLVLNK